MTKGDDIQLRLVKLAVALVHICDTMPDSKAGGHVASQLLRACTSAAPNYAEARSAESDRDFVHKMKVVLKELNESIVWLSIIQEGGMLTEADVQEAREECTVTC